MEFLWIQHLGSANLLCLHGNMKLIVYFYSWFYWTDIGTDTIERASMDGKSRMVLHNSSLSNTYAITIDYENQELYWADSTLNKIEKSDTNGSNRVTLTSSVRNPFPITYYNGRLFWGDNSLNRILTGTANSPDSGTYVGGHFSYDVYTIHVLSRDTQPLGKTLKIAVRNQVYVTIYIVI